MSKSQRILDEITLLNKRFDNLESIINKLSEKVDQPKPI